MASAGEPISDRKDIRRNGATKRQKKGRNMKKYDLNAEKMQEILKRDLTSKNWQGYCKDRSEHAPSTLCLVHTEQSTSNAWNSNKWKDTGQAPHSWVTQANARAAESFRLLPPLKTSARRRASEAVSQIEETYEEKSKIERMQKHWVFQTILMSLKSCKESSTAWNIQILHFPQSSAC